MMKREAKAKRDALAADTVIDTEGKFMERLYKRLEAVAEKRRLCGQRGHKWKTLMSSVRNGWQRTELRECQKCGELETRRG